MYKDKNKQKEAAKQAKARWKVKQGSPDKGIPQGIPAKEPEGIPDLERCQYCGEPLPQLQLPRQYPGACYPCALKQPVKTGDNLWPVYRYDDRPYSEQVQMTEQEQASYKSASQLGPGEFNKVSKPGDADYVGCMS